MKNKVVKLMILLLLSLILISCDDAVQLKEHNIKEEGILSYIVIQGRTSFILNFESKEEEITTFDIYLNTKVEEDFTYKFDIYNLKDELLTYESKEAVKSPSNIKIMHSSNTAGNGFKEMSLEIKTTKQYNFYEEIIIIQDELNSKKYKEEITDENIDLEIVNLSTTEDLNLQFNFSNINAVHLDMQSYLVKGNAFVYSFLGVYNYNPSSEELIIENNYVDNDMDFEYLYILINYYNKEGTKAEIKVKYALEDLR